MADRCQPMWAREVSCEIRFDDLARALYATDASVYQITPIGVAFPESAAEAASAISVAAEAGVSIIPRGAGTGLAGGAVGDGLVIDFSRYNRDICDLNRDARTVRVGAGVVLDQLNAYLRPHGLCFGPDVATSSRATLGGMIANNSSGSNAPIYGTTVDHVRGVEVILADGRVVTAEPNGDGLAVERAEADRLVERYAQTIRRRMPDVLLKRWPGYQFDHYLRHPGDLSKLIAGSEGTLAGIMSAELNLVPLPGHRGLAVVCFASAAEALQAAVELADFQPAAIEHIDRLLFDQTKGQLAFRSARALLKLDGEPCESMLLVEFFGDADDKMAALKARKMGLRTFTTTDPAQMQAVWSVRRKGLNLLTGCEGPAKPTSGIEDVAVRPQQLPEYVRSLKRILDGVGVQASYYGHAASGILHVRPVLDLHTAEGVALYRQIAEEVSALTRQFEGSIAGEHGVGVARTEFLPEQLGAELMTAAAALKRLFDPKNVFNPGKIVGDERYRIDTNLRTGAGHEILLPFCPTLGFVRRDRSFVGNLEQCNGTGECVKMSPTMCPTYLATGEEIMSTRGRANTIRAVLEHRLADPAAMLDSPELDEALSNCLSCKACKTECPSNVDMAALKAELLHARQQRDGVRLLDHLFSAVDLMGRFGCATAPVANAALEWPALRWLMEKAVGIAAERPLPPYASQRFDKWFARRQTNGEGRRGRVVLWDDTFVRYHEPHIGRAAVAVLEAAGYEVRLPEGRECCGRPAFSRGRLDEAARLGRHNVELLRRIGGDEAIVFLEPSCYSMFVDDYLELGVPGAERLAARCMLFEQFISDLLEREPDALRFRPGARHVAVHGHCHVKALVDQGVQARLLNRLPGTSAETMDTGCCGMAGAFGALKSKYELSVRVAQPLVEQIEALSPDTTLVACGTSCRHQITHLTKATPLHVAEVMADALVRSATVAREVRAGRPIG